MPLPDLGDWNTKRPQDLEPALAARAEGLAWSAIDTLTAGRIAHYPITVRPQVLDGQGQIRLARPVGGVVDVRIAGVSVSDWRLDEPNILIRLNAGTWTLESDMSLPASAPDVVEVDYYQGWRPGRLLIWAAAELAAEFYAAIAGDPKKKCRLPSNVTAVTRQGVSFEMTPELFGDGRTGIKEIDVVIQRYNPYAVKAPAVFASPESISQAPRRIS